MCVDQPDQFTKDRQTLTYSTSGTAAQIVPAIMEPSTSVTQIIRSQHWVVERGNFTYPPWMIWAFRHIPLLHSLHRFAIYQGAEADWQLFPMTKSAAQYRQKRRVEIESYMRRTAPAKYHDILIPDFEVGCKVYHSILR